MSRGCERLGIMALCAGLLRDNQFIRFVLIGCVNTIVTYVIYVGLVTFMPYGIAYTVTTALGILISYLLNARYVFRRKLRLAAALQYPMVYLLQYVFGLVTLYLLVEKAGFNKLVAPLLIVCVSVPATFILSRHILGRRRGIGGPPNR